MCMGANKPAYIKRAAEKILEEYGDRFTDNFAQNKKTLDELFIIRSKEVKHRIAGYITRRKKAGEKKEREQPAMVL